MKELDPHQVYGTDGIPKNLLNEYAERLLIWDSHDWGMLTLAMLAIKKNARKGNNGILDYHKICMHEEGIMELLDYHNIQKLKFSTYS